MTTFYKSKQCSFLYFHLSQKLSWGRVGQVGRQLFLQYTAITQKSQMGNLNTSERGLPFEREGPSV